MIYFKIVVDSVHSSVISLRHKIVHKSWCVSLNTLETMSQQQGLKVRDDVLKKLATQKHVVLTLKDTSFFDDEEEDIMYDAQLQYKPTNKSNPLSSEPSRFVQLDSTGQLKNSRDQKRLQTLTLQQTKLPTSLSSSKTQCDHFTDDFEAPKSYSHSIIKSKKRKKRRRSHSKTLITLDTDAAKQPPLKRININIKGEGDSFIPFKRGDKLEHYSQAPRVPRSKDKCPKQPPSSRPIAFHALAARAALTDEDEDPLALLKQLGARRRQETAPADQAQRSKENAIGTAHAEPKPLHSLRELQDLSTEAPAGGVAATLALFRGRSSTSAPLAGSEDQSRGAVEGYTRSGQPVYQPTLAPFTMVGRDDLGRELTQKQEFNRLSHAFHGTAPGLTKQHRTMVRAVLESRSRAARTATGAAEQVRRERGIDESSRVNISTESIR
eukprot:gnl/Dysnectes_brevis/1522_a1726_1857.p1 GENE.gnl/Dysnectes_brevis/1522_a1726_1857~~gnl/Dysnectes_brevis/1522_a1726_1857.p1  ORF type:complete len:438 (-),score=69.70 gnl/Dysnectes_brevis/1522_a1726_1857:31-1344(-)